MIRPLRWAGHPVLWLHYRHPWWFVALSTAFVVALGLLIDVATNGRLDQSFRIVTVAIGWCAGVVAATFANRSRTPRTRGRTGGRPDEPARRRERDIHDVRFR